MTQLLAFLRAVKPSRRTLKAVVSGVVTLAAYLVATLGANDDLGDLTTVQWLGAVVFVGAAYGITYRVPNTP